ncbi:hypothetical protein ACFP3Q_14045 [Nocardioides sp. GCM10027113]|uniref:hypothetical protein n=1 Tax=unclassified Nocardioides TaxID=2615069 RepID=UPI003618251C
MTALLGGLLVALTPQPGVAGPRASLTVSPRVYVGGQAVTFTGNVGRTGERRIVLQQHLGRSGDSWERVEGFSARTDRSGDFRFTHPAPSMFGIRYRVKTKGSVTPAWTFKAKSQDLTVKAVSGVSGLRANQVLAGRRFTVRVDTTPDLFRRPDVDGLKPIPGRKLTLQRRVDGDTWTTLQTTTVDDRGNGRFGVTVADPGTVVYRVRMEDWTAGAHEIGWFPSFPTYVRVLDRAPRVAARTAPVSRSAPERTATHRDVSNATASKAFGWAPARFDFAWVSGESLTSPPYRGTHRSGWWQDYTGGAGRVAKHNGGLTISSKRENAPGRGDFGTTRATLRDHALTYGRWEVRLRARSHESSRGDYRAKVELVPVSAADHDCGARSITVADFAAHGRRVLMGANAVTRKWRRSRDVGPLDNRPMAVAVEVTRRHISWFVNGRVAATLKNQAAIPDVPLTLRLSLVGKGKREMNHTDLISDWQRGFTLEHGRTVASGPGLASSPFSGGC